MAKIDIIVPVYKTEKFLKQCLESIINQTFEDIEIICVNDGSPDKSLKILEKYAQKDCRIKVITQKNLGLSGARNTGIENSNSELIMFVDSDDYIDNTMCEKMYNAAQNADIAVCGVQEFEGKKRFLKPKNSYFELNFEGQNDIFDYIVEKTNVVACNKIFRRTVLNEYNVRFPQVLHFEDNPFFFSFMSIARSVFFLNEKLYFYRKHSRTITAQKNDGHKFDYIYGAKHYYDFLVKHNKYEEKKKLFWFYWLKVFELCKKQLNENDCRTLYDICAGFLNWFDTDELKEFLSEADYQLICNILDRKYFIKKEYTLNYFGLQLFKYKKLEHKTEVFVFGLPGYKNRNAVNYKEIKLFNKVIKSSKFL